MRGVRITKKKKPVDKLHIRAGMGTCTCHFVWGDVALRNE